jgi:predicted membrane chloride channel (bestrophin family)
MPFWLLNALVFFGFCSTTCDAYVQLTFRRYHQPCWKILSTQTQQNNRIHSPVKRYSVIEYTGDSLEKYARDIQKVLELRSSYYDPTVPKIHHRKRSFTNTWTLEEWKRHSSRRRYIDHILAFHRSRILARVAPPLAVLMAWTCLVCWVYDRCAAPTHIISMAPLSLVSTFVAALLTLRSNQGLSRLNEGRLAFGKVVLYTRDMAQLIASNVYPKDRALGLKAARHVALFAWLLKGFLRGDEVNGTDEDILRVMLPCSQKERKASVDGLSADAAYILQQRKRPVAVVTRLRQIFALMLSRGLLTTSEASRLDHNVQQLNYCIMITERIQASPIPPVYTTHTARLLLFYLFHLPLALRGSNMLDSVATFITTTAVAYTMIGLDEISIMTEEPFRLMPLWHLAKNSLRDCGDALTCEPPPLILEEEDEETYMIPLNKEIEEEQPAMEEEETSFYL